MTIFTNLLSIVLLLLSSWKIASGEETQNLDDMEDISEKDMFHVKDNRLAHNIPNMRQLVLNSLLRNENSLRQPTETDTILPLSSRSKGTTINADDPLAVLATGFLGSRGKRLSYDDLPIFVNGFPAHRGRK